MLLNRNEEKQTEKASFLVVLFNFESLLLRHFCWWQRRNGWTWSPLAQCYFSPPDFIDLLVYASEPSIYCWDLKMLCLLFLPIRLCQNWVCHCYSRITRLTIYNYLSAASKGNPISFSCMYVVVGVVCSTLHCTAENKRSLHSSSQMLRYVLL